MKSVKNKINSLLSHADSLAEKEVERLARYVLSKNPHVLSSFTMAMGTYFFCDIKGEIIHDSIGSNENKLKRMAGYNKLVSFISEFDGQLKITGNSMNFTAKGKKITNW